MRPLLVVLPLALAACAPGAMRQIETPMVTEGTGEPPAAGVCIARTLESSLPTSRMNVRQDKAWTSVDVVSHYDESIAMIDLQDLGGGRLGVTYYVRSDLLFRQATLNPVEAAIQACAKARPARRAEN